MPPIFQPVSASVGCGRLPSLPVMTLGLPGASGGQEKGSG